MFLSIIEPSNVNDPRHFRNKQPLELVSTGKQKILFTQLRKCSEIKDKNKKNSPYNKRNSSFQLKVYLCCCHMGLFYARPDHVVDRLESYSGRILLQGTLSQGSG